ncbi:MAG: PqqD family peptide modification chaperone [Thermodesulfobacteriota bacterium]
MSVRAVFEFSMDKKDLIEKSCPPRSAPYTVLERRSGLNLILHQERPAWAVVNDVGLQVLKLCRGDLKVEEITSTIASRFGEGQSAIMHDIAGYINRLKRSNLIMTGNGRTPNGEYVPSLKGVSLNITGKCNLHCRHCAVVDAPVSRKSLIYKEICRIIDELKDIDGSGLAVTGGEPLFRKEWLRILRYAMGKTRISLLTNGTLLNEYRAKVIADMDIDVQISLDGSNPSVHDHIRGKGAFEKTMKGVRLLLENDMAGKMLVNTCVTGFNIDDIPAIIDLVSGMGIPYIRFLPLKEIGNARKNWKEISVVDEEQVRIYKKLFNIIFHTSHKIKINSGLKGFFLSFPEDDDPYWQCPLGSRLIINEYGDIYPCPALMNMRMNNQRFSLGNVRETSLDEAISSQRLRDLKLTFLSRKNLIGKCVTCCWRHLCGSGCAGSVFLAKGDFLQTDDLCAIRQELYKETIFELASNRVSTDSLVTDIMPC